MKQMFGQRQPMENKQSSKYKIAKHISTQSIINLIEIFFISDAVDIVDTWRAMEKLVDLGLTRSIGLSNFNSEQVDRILSMARIKPVTNQVECSPLLNQKKLITFLKERNITLTAYCPLAKGKAPFYDDARVAAIAEKYNKTSAQIALRYLVSKNMWFFV